MLSFIRLCNSAKNIYNCLDNDNKKYTVSIAALRSIFDGYEPNDREYFIKYLLKDYLPENLKNLLIEKDEDKDKNNTLKDNPFEYLEKEEMIVSKISGIK